MSCWKSPIKSDRVIADIYKDENKAGDMPPERVGRIFGFFVNERSPTRPPQKRKSPHPASPRGGDWINALLSEELRTKSEELNTP